MALCSIEGRPAMYGMGIRIAFYAQWFGAVFMSHVDEASLPPIRLHGLLLSSATILALILQAMHESLHGVEIYIVLLLAAGIYMPLVPVYIIRGLTLCHPVFTPLSWSKERSPPAINVFNFIVALMVASVGIWFFTTFLPRADGGCVQYGFFLTKVPLESAAYIASNAILYIVMLLVCAGKLLNSLGIKVENWHKARRKARHARRSHAKFWRTVCTISNITVTSTLISAIELTIKWNNIPSVNAVDAAAQTIPLLLSVICVLVVVFWSYKNYRRQSDRTSARASKRRATPSTSTSSSSSSSGYMYSSAPSNRTRRMGHYGPAGKVWYKTPRAPSRAYTA